MLGSARHVNGAAILGTVNITAWLHSFYLWICIKLIIKLLLSLNRIHIPNSTFLHKVIVSFLFESSYSTLNGVALSVRMQLLHHVGWNGKIQTRSWQTRSKLQLRVSYYALEGLLHFLCACSLKVIRTLMALLVCVLVFRPELNSGRYFSAALDS